MDQTTLEAAEPKFSPQQQALIAVLAKHAAGQLQSSETIPMRINMNPHDGFRLGVNIALGFLMVWGIVGIVCAVAAAMLR